MPPGSWRAYSFSLAEQSALCEQYYNVTPRVRWLETWSGGYAIADRASGHSNIIWSNGRRDPWHGGGFLRARQAPEDSNPRPLLSLRRRCRRAAATSLLRVARSNLVSGSDALPGGAVFVMEETAHHQDLRLPKPATDPPELTRVREQEEKIIRGWLGM